MCKPWYPPSCFFFHLGFLFFILSVYEFCWHHSKSLNWCFLTQPANTSLKDYGRFQKDGELKVLSHMDSRVRNRCVLPAIALGFPFSFLLVRPWCCVFVCSRWGWFCKQQWFAVVLGVMWESKHLLLLFLAFLLFFFLSVFLYTSFFSWELTLANVWSH